MQKVECYSVGASDVPYKTGQILDIGPTRWRVVRRITQEEFLRRHESNLRQQPGYHLSMEAEMVETLLDPQRATRARERLEAPEDREFCYELELLPRPNVLSGR